MTLKQKREAAGLSQERLAKLAGVASSSVSRIETGRNKDRSDTEHKLHKVLANYINESR